MYILHINVYLDRTMKFNASFFLSRKNQMLYYDTVHEMVFQLHMVCLNPGKHFLICYYIIFVICY
jgi:hypothetical protein